MMTVQASNGLEFPVVVVVNLARGASGFPRPIRVSGDDVSVGPFVSESDEAERFLEREETKRLLYVALTRARDRLYLGSIVKDGALAAGRGSLADVVPASLRALFGRAAQEGGDSIEWTAESGRLYRFRVCRADPPPAVPTEVGQHESSTNPMDRAAQRVDNFSSLTDPAAVERLPVTQSLAHGPVGVGATRLTDGNADDALVGTLVHRLFQFGAGLPSAGPEDFARLAEKLLRPDERATAADAVASLARAVEAWTAMSQQPDVAALLASGERLHELTFSLVAPDEPSRVVRGTIDCLVRRPDGSIVIVEFKTGAPSPAHAAQLDVYVAAARAMYPGASVSARVVYPR
jgi:ATP-dependent helicase/nuclease subunit A